MLAALTILPALLSRFGDRIARGGTRTLLRRRTGASRSGLWLRWSHAIARRPWRGLIAGLVVMVGLAIPALSLRAGTSDAGNDASSLTSRHAYDLIARSSGPATTAPCRSSCACLTATTPRQSTPWARHCALRATSPPSPRHSSAPRARPRCSTHIRAHRRSRPRRPGWSTVSVGTCSRRWPAPRRPAFLWGAPARRGRSRSSISSSVWSRIRARSLVGCWRTSV